MNDIRAYYSVPASSSGKAAVSQSPHSQKQIVQPVCNEPIVRQPPNNAALTNDNASSTNTEDNASHNKPTISSKFTWLQKKAAIECNNEIIQNDKKTVHVVTDEHILLVNRSTLRNWRTGERLKIKAICSVGDGQLAGTTSVRFDSGMQTEINKKINMLREEENRKSNSITGFASGNLSIGGDSSSDIKTNNCQDDDNAKETKFVSKEQYDKLAKELEHVQNLLLHQTVNNASFEKYNSNAEMISKITRELLEHINTPKSERVMVDFHYGEGNFHNDDTDNRFNTVYNFDYVKHGERSSTNKNDILSYTELHSLIKKYPKGFADIAIADPPYYIVNGGYNAFNSSTDSRSFQKKNYNFGVDMKWSERQLLLMALEAMEFATRVLKNGGFLLLKSQQGDINLTNMIIEASCNTNLVRLGTDIPFPSSRAKKKNDSGSYHLALNRGVSLLTVFKLNTKKISKSAQSNKPTLQELISSNRHRARSDFVKQGIKKRAKNLQMRKCFENLLKYATDNIESMSSVQDWKQMLRFASKYHHFDVNDNIQWTRFEVADWSLPGITSDKYETLQNGYKAEDTMHLSITDMCAVVFSRIVKHLGNEDESMSKYDRTILLRKCHIVGDTQKIFCNDDIGRLHKNVDELIKAQEELDAKEEEMRKKDEKKEKKRKKQLEKQREAEILKHNEAARRKRYCR